MGRHSAVLLLAALAAPIACTHAASNPVVASGDRSGLKLRMTLTSTSSSLVVETRVANRRHTAVHLVPDQCGRVTEVVLARTRFEPVGRAWPGSLGAVKRYIVVDQRTSQDPDSFEPRRPGGASSRVPDCLRPDHPVTLRPGGTIDERWELPFAHSLGLAAVGSAHSAVRAEIVEARNASEAEFLDMLAPGGAAAEYARRGRSLRLEQDAARVLDRPTTARRAAPSAAQLYDRLLRNATLREWLTAQPVRSWRSGQLMVMPNDLRFKAVTTRYERAVTATARPDASDVHVRLPARGDRARTWLRRAPTLPPGIALAQRQHGWTPTQDVLPGKVRLPSGRIVVGEYLLDAKPLAAAARPGVYPVRATLARYKRSRFANVALATLVLSSAPTVRWRHETSVAVDGGTTTITSAEGAAALRDLFRRSQERWQQRSDEMFDSLAAHDYEVTQFALAPRLNLALFSSGNGDGRYPVFVGFDAAGRPTRIVVDFLLLRLRWP